MMAARVPLLALDGGGTKCLAVFADREGRMLASGRAGSCNYQGTGREAAALELTRAIREAKRQLAASAAERGEAPLEPGAASASSVRKERADIAEDGPLVVACAVFGVAGLDTGHDRQVIEGMVREALARTRVTADRVVVENDGVAALLGATGGAPGILVIAVRRFDRARNQRSRPKRAGRRLGPPCRRRRQRVLDRPTGDPCRFARIRRKGRPYGVNRQAASASGAAE